MGLFLLLKMHYKYIFTSFFKLILIYNYDRITTKLFYLNFITN